MEKIRYFYEAIIQKAKDLWTFVRSDEFLSWDLGLLGTYSAAYFGITFLVDTNTLPGAYGLVAGLLCYTLIMFAFLSITNHLRDMYHKFWVCHQVFNDILEEVDKLRERVRELEQGQKKPLGD